MDPTKDPPRMTRALGEIVADEVGGGNRAAAHERSLKPSGSKEAFARCQDLRYAGLDRQLWQRRLSAALGRVLGAFVDRPLRHIRRRLQPLAVVVRGLPLAVVVRGLPPAHVPVGSRRVVVLHVLTLLATRLARQRVLDLLAEAPVVGVLTHKTLLAVDELRQPYSSLRPRTGLLTHAVSPSSGSQARCSTRQVRRMGSRRLRA